MNAPQPAPVNRPPGTVVTWQEKVKDLPPITGDPEMVKRIWQNTDGLAYMYIWQLLLSF